MIEHDIYAATVDLLKAQASKQAKEAQKESQPVPQEPRSFYTILLTEMAKAPKRIVISSRTSNASLGQLAFRATDPAVRAAAKAERDRRIAAAERQPKIKPAMERLKAHAQGQQLSPEELLQLSAVVKKASKRTIQSTLKQAHAELSKQREMDEFAEKVKRQAVRQERARQKKAAAHGNLPALRNPDLVPAEMPENSRSLEPAREDKPKRSLLKKLFSPSGEHRGELVDVDRQQDRLREIESDPLLKGINQRRTKDRNALEAIKHNLSSREYRQRFNRWAEKYRRYGFSKDDPFDVDLDVDAPTKQETKAVKRQRTAAELERDEMNKRRTWEFRQLEWDAERQGRKSLFGTDYMVWLRRWQRKGFEEDDELDPHVDVHWRESL